MKFIREFGLGLLYILALPVFLVAVAGTGVVALLEWIVMLFVGLIRFFKGDSFFKPLEEDEIVNRMREQEKAQKTGEKEEKPEEPAAPAQGPVYVQQNYYQQQQQPIPPYGGQIPNPGYGIPPQFPQQQQYQNPQYINQGYGNPQYPNQNPTQIPHQNEEPTQIGVIDEKGDEQ